MKKLALLAALALMGTAAWAANSSIVQLNNFGPPDSPIYYLKSGTAAKSDINVQLLGGPVGGALSAVKNTTGQDTFQIIAGADGYFDGGIGIIPGVADGGRASLELRAWKGASYDAATEKGSQKWNQATTSADLTPPNLPPATIAALAIPANVLVAAGGQQVGS